ncbi:hypothetical protein [Allokutzneria albata]|uniref:Uncharacterized protein n=1 Tax=Allokutzneria albata TaxID=211114 RepID=A0A1G9SDQ0_ALLAB|nr:hypothetical protein [Allokutzneria albata]SDM33437.1 hypothetical protein SAMN04489726_1086 [Allokutzneria albata]
MSLRTKVSAALVATAAVAGMLVAAPAAFAEGCSTDPYGNMTCTANPGSGGTVSLHLYARPDGNYMQGKDS